MSGWIHVAPLYRIGHTVLFGLLGAVLLPLVAVGQPQTHSPSDALASSFVRSHVPPNMQMQTPQEWANRLRWSHARGRANLATLIPMGLGSIAYSIDEAREGASFPSPLFIAGTCLGAVGIAIGPSMGLWCTGNSTLAWRSFGVRTAGLGAIGVGVWRASRIIDTEEDGLAAIVAAPFVLLINMLPGLVITSVGAGWALNATPNRFCDSANGTRVSLAPRADATGAQGLALTVRW